MCGRSALFASLAAVLLGPLGMASYAEEPAWGATVDGLRIGVKAQADAKTAPTWVVVYANAGEKEIAIPETFPRQALLRVTAGAARRSEKGLTVAELAASAPGLSADKAEAAIEWAPKASFEVPVAALLAADPLLTIVACASFRAEAPDGQPEAPGWQDIAESKTVALRRTKTGWAVARDEKGEDVKRDDWATPEEIWAEFLARKPEFLAALQTTNWKVRCEAAAALALMGADAKEAVAGLAGLLDQDDPTEEEVWHQTVVAALGALARHDPGAVAALVKPLAAPKDENRKVRLAAVKALGGLAAGAERIAALAKALKDPWSAVRCEAALALGKLGPAAKEALPALQEAVKDPLGVVHEAALDAVKSVSGGK